MRIQIPLVVEMSDEQVAAWAAEYGLPVEANGMPRAKIIVDDVRAYVVNSTKGSITGEFATITLKH